MGGFAAVEIPLLATPFYLFGYAEPARLLTGAPFALLRSFF